MCQLFPFLLIEHESRDYSSPAYFSIFLKTDPVSPHFVILLCFLLYMGTHFLLHQVIGSPKHQTLLLAKRAVSSARKDLFGRSRDRRIQIDTDTDVLE